MQITILSPRKALNKAYLKVKPLRIDIERFKHNLINLLNTLDASESEEHSKNDLGNFLRDTFYHPKFYINTRERTDLVIHNGKDAKSKAGLLIEVKKPGNKSEMISQDCLNVKAFHELVLYFLRERITNHNLEIKHVAITNIYEWYIFDATYFEKIFAQNKSFVKQFTDFEEGRLAGKNTDFFYKDIAAPFIEKLTTEIVFAWFDFRDYEKPLRNTDKNDDSKLIALYKLLSPEHLLKLPFANDSNSLDKTFYAELLHIIGLTETKEGSKKLIGRKKENERDAGSLIENAIVQLENLDKLSRLEKPYRYGASTQERLFNVALELVITWINRILFLKLLEAQLIKYNKGDKDFSFLNSDKIQNFDDLNSLFFGVLARMPDQRGATISAAFAHVPYLNSSLFEPTEPEHSCLFISQLNDARLPVIASTVLKDNLGRKFKGELVILDYLFQFLDAYDFAGDGAEEIQEENKTLINASVLGLIFEKINGYKDGSFFTPGYITMYMSRETIRRAVVQKFDEYSRKHDLQDIKIDTIEDIYELIPSQFSRTKANAIINSLKICDPAVGSGHFLVSTLNEIISIKNDLKILEDKNGKSLNRYEISVVNDELVVTNEDGELFEYKPQSLESQRVQETLFHEKQTIIENCLFGVDINPNSVKICRLRLWIELLKNAYYKNLNELETLPNIDINIKCGNSLISRYALDADIKQVLKRSKWNIQSYRLAVMSYRNAANKEEKREMERLINLIRNDFQTIFSLNDPRKRKRDKLGEQLYDNFGSIFLFEPEADYNHKAIEAKRKKEREKIENEINRLSKEIEEVKNSAVYENAFEWRFEFPEVLNDEGDFIGFDVVIGNPPYGVKFNSSEKTFFANNFITTDDIYTIFFERGLGILNCKGILSFITPVFWLTGDNYLTTRKLILKDSHLEKGITLPYDIFTDAYVDTGIFVFSKNKKSTFSNIFEFKPKEKIDLNSLTTLSFNKLDKNEWKNSEDHKIIFNQLSRSLTNKIKKFEKNISNVTESIRGILAEAQDYSESQVNTDFKQIFTGKLGRYYMEDVFQYVKYGENLKEKPISFHFFEGERILVRRIVNRQFRIMATIATNSFVNKKDIYVFKSLSSDFTSKYLLAVINSRLISFLKTKGSASAKKDDFTQLTLNDIRQINLPIPSYEQKMVVDGLVNQILSLKKSDPTANITVLEAEIDLLVYQLYGLTDEEIKIVEEGVK